MKVISANVNGIRSAARKGFFDWVQSEQPDVLCLQETRAGAHQLEDAIFHPAGYESFFHVAHKPGYSGVAIYTRKSPDRVIKNLGWPGCDTEGRYIQVDFGSLSIGSVYLPSGSSGAARQAAKFEFMDHYQPLLVQQQNKQQSYILCGDWNIAHKIIDIKNWRGNMKNSGFLPEERAWMDKLFGDWGYVDAFRIKNQAAEEYTWWSSRGRARENNVGWRIDYQVITPELVEKVESVSIFRERIFSDHAPLTINYSLIF